MEFINRTQEISTLNQLYNKAGSSMVVLYGRRRVGKTALLREFIKDKAHLYFLADLQNEKLQIERLSLQFGQLLNDHLLANLKPTDWFTLFEYGFKHSSRQGKIIFIIDEFQYLTQINSAFPSIMQRSWDELLLNQNVMLILCGSSIHMMYQTTLSHNSPLYGRRDLQIKLKMLNFIEFSKFFPSLSSQNRFSLYCLTGGIPKYIEQLPQESSLQIILRDYFLNPNSFLYPEPRFLLQEEVHDPTSYYSIIQVIAAGNHQLGHIAQRFGLATHQITKVLERLRELEIITRLVPITEKRPDKSKLGLYIISDPFFRFWFRYVFPWQSLLEMGQTQYVTDKYLSERTTFEGPLFEQLCRDLIWFSPHLPTPLQQIGAWWNRQIEIDLVGIGENYHIVGECKWQNQPVGLKVLKELEIKSQHIPLKTKPYFYLFAKHGFQENLQREAQKRDDLVLLNFEQLLGLYPST